MKYLSLVLCLVLIKSASGMPCPWLLNEPLYFCENKPSLDSLPDSITLMVYVSFTVNEKGETKEVSHDRTECLNYELSQLDAAKIIQIEAEALRVVRELENLPPQKKPLRFTLPIRSKMPASWYLKEDEPSVQDSTSKAE